MPLASVTIKAEKLSFSPTFLAPCGRGIEGEGTGNIVNFHSNLTW
jgi:hypothetical protein